MSHTRAWTRGVLASGFLLLGACTRAPDLASHAPTRHEVEIRGMAFVPVLASAAVGDTIVFINRDMFPHTASQIAGGWDSGEIAAGDSAVVVLVATDDGAYRCALHPTMQGTIRIDSVGTT